MVDYLPRSAWGARTARSGPGDLTPSRVVGTAVHWPGTESSKPISKTGVASALRGWQDYHMDGRDWSDIAYQIAVDQWGRAWTLRGLRTQSGANGDNSVNETYGAVLLVLVQGEQPSEAMKATVREVMADYNDLYPSWKVVVGHGDIRPNGGTDCPGPAAKAALKRGEFNPTNHPDTPPEDDVNPTDIAAIADAVYKKLEPRLKAYTQDLKNYEAQTDGPDAARAGAAAEAEILTPANLDKIATAVAAKIAAGASPKA